MGLRGRILFMRDDRRSSASSVFWSLAIGVAAGYAAGLLTAEKPGRDLRREIGANSADFIANLKDKLEDLKEQTAEAVQTFKGFADEKLKASAKNIEDQVQKLGKQLEDLTKRQPALNKN